MTEFTHPFASKVPHCVLTDEQLRADIQRLEGGLISFRSRILSDGPNYGDAFPHFCEHEPPEPHYNRLGTVLRLQRELCHRSSLEFARAIHVPALPDDAAVRVDLQKPSGLRVTYRVASHCPNPWPEKPDDFKSPKDAESAWIGFHDVLHWRSVRKCLVDVDWEGWRTGSILFAEGEGITCLLLDRIGQRWGRVMAGGCGFLFEIENSRLTRCFQLQARQQVRHWRVEMRNDVIEVVAAGVEIPDVVASLAE
jgi:hypothetical protein